MSRIATRIDRIEKAARAQNAQACGCHGVDGEALTAEGRKVYRRCPRCGRHILEVTLTVPGIMPEEMLTPPTSDF